MFKGEPYFFSRIYTVSQIDDEGYLDIGEIVLLGTYKDESELKDFQVTLTYLSTEVS